MALALLPFKPMIASNITNLPIVIGFTWKQVGLLAAFGVVIGLVLALAARLPVS